MRMNRRDVLKLAAQSAVFAQLAPIFTAPAQAAGKKELRYIPEADLNILDPVWSTSTIVAVYGHMVFDTLYGFDKDYNVHPQMAEGHSVSDDKLQWTVKLRDGLQFHDGQPVLAKDCVASIQRWGKRDFMGSALLSVVETLTAVDDRTLQFKLKKPFPLLPMTLATSGSNMPAMMPERLAQTSPNEQVRESIGSGPYRFVKEEWVSGSKAVFEKFAGYKPRSDSFPPSYTAGPKIAHFDRVVWNIIADASTAAAALQAGEVDIIEMVGADFLPVLKAEPSVQLLPRSTPNFAIMRFNHLQPPFNNPAIRQALLKAIDQRAIMAGTFGEENKAFWQFGVGYFSPDSPMANKAGLEAFTSPRDFKKAAAEIKAAGYDGEPVVVLDPVDYPWTHPCTLLAADTLKKVGLNVDIQAMDWGTLMQRRQSQEPPGKGGWNIFLTALSGMSNFNPVGHIGLRGNGKDAWVGWPTAPRLEELRQQWLDAPDEAAQKKICEEIQKQALVDVPYIPLGAFATVSGYSNNLTDIQLQRPLFTTMKTKG
ncbi:Peptide/nickel transport system substrate-binding protein OS=Bosea thiooxidans OX=53254 GN=SAMN05660750_02097 PE=3 SV=1 [Bosea thiooxidans]|uniref:Peptide/nickel transport system substrate-binding protein n=2 Tax=Bosea thiooxidans TaxID=53254 RepID=A0A1T5DLD2_9HYPH|nr:peptide/nickel transport system substrate-binding protein [Bosea thiooxidans]